MMKYGRTWDLKAEHISNTFEIKECQHVKREFSTDFDPNLKNDDDQEDDFDADDDDE